MSQSGMELKRRIFGVENWGEQNSTRARAVAVAVFCVSWHPNFDLVS